VEPEPDQTVAIEVASPKTVHAFRWNLKIHVDAISRETTRGHGCSLLGPSGGASRTTADSFSFVATHTAMPPISFAPTSG